MKLQSEKAEHTFNETAKTMSIPSRLHLLVEYYASEILFTTSFGKEDQLLTHFIATNNLPIPIITLDTGRLFPETYLLWQQTEEKYGLRIKAHYPDHHELSSLVADQGINGFYYSKQMREACCMVRKLMPLQAALKNIRLWLTGLRRQQSFHRSAIDFIQNDPTTAIVKGNPLYDLSNQDLEQLINNYQIPVNSLHEAGFSSIGCAPCTRAIKAGEDERAGRWWWESDSPKECGLHNKIGVKPYPGSSL